MGSNKRYGHLPRYFPPSVSILGPILTHMPQGVEIKVSCDRCGMCRPADIVGLAKVLGMTASLVDRHPACKTPDCTGRVLFAYSSGPSTMFRPLITGTRVP